MIMNEEKLIQFMNYLRTEFPEPLESHFAYDLIENLVIATYIKFGNKKGEARKFLETILPELTNDELEYLLPDYSEF